MKRHCGRPIGGRGEGMPKVDKCGQGEGGGKKWYFCADVLYGWPPKGYLPHTVGKQSLIYHGKETL